MSSNGFRKGRHSLSQPHNHINTSYQPATVLSSAGSTNRNRDNSYIEKKLLNTLSIEPDPFSDSLNDPIAWLPLFHFTGGGSGAHRQTLL